MHFGERQPEAGHAGLARAQDIAFAAQTQVLLGMRKPFSVTRMMENRALAVSPSGAR